MSRPAAPFLLVFTCAALGMGGIGSARADSQVPDVAPRDLPVAGTCAPLDTTDVTRLLVGPTGLYRVDGRAEVLDQPGLESLLAQRSGGTQDKPGRHSVWVAVPAAQTFLPLRAVIAACAKAGIFRLGLEVQAEQGGAGFGFPLFIPGPKPLVDPSVAASKGRRLEVMLDRWEGAPSHPRRLFAAAQAASQKFPPVVAEVSLDVNLSVQHVVTCLDLLYRGGCAGVLVKLRESRGARATNVLESTDPRNRAGSRDTAVPLNLKATIVRGTDRRDLGPTVPNAEVPPLAPRPAPWSDDGANAPGALTLVLEDLPAAAGSAKTEADTEPLPSYAGKREGVPTTVVVAADKALDAWAGRLGRVLVEALNRKFDPKTAPLRFASRFRTAERLGALVEPSAQMFPGAQRVTPSTLTFDVYLVKGLSFVGKVAVTLHVAGSAISFIRAEWRTELDVPEGFTLPPAAADPFAAGVPGHVRVWLEAAFDTVYRQGAAGLPLAPATEVLAQLPAVAHAGATNQLDARGPALELLAKWLGAMEYDRLVIAPRVGTAAVHLDGQVVGILTYELESEEHDLKLVSLRGRDARPAPGR